MLHSDTGKTKRDDLLAGLLTMLEKVETRLAVLERAKSGGSQKKQKGFWERFSDDVSIVGFKEMFTSGKWSIRFIWMMIFGMCILATGYFIYKTMLEYMTEPTATKVKLIEQDQYEYPVMLLCPSTWLDAEKVHGDGLSIQGLQYALGFLINYYVRPPPYQIEEYERAKSDFEQYYHARKFKDLVEFFKFVALDSRDFVYQCPFCVNNNTFRKILMSDAICYQIPMHSTPGNAPVVNSLDHLDVIVPDRSLNLLAPASYWRLFLGLDLHLGEATRRHAEVYPHHFNTIQFITHKFVSVDKQGNRCVNGQIGNYSFARCVLECFLEEGLFLMTSCSMDTCDNSRLIPNQTFNYYAEDLWDKLVSMQTEAGQEKSSEAPKHCYDNCPPQCQRAIYTIDVQSHSRLPMPEDVNVSDSENQNRRIDRFVTPENLTRLSFLNTAAVYGGVLTFEEVSTYSFETMVGNVGGMLSLWLGVSIMSLIQIVMFLMSEWYPQTEEKEHNHLDVMASVTLLEKPTVCIYRNSRD